MCVGELFQFLCGLCVELHNFVKWNEIITTGALDYGQSRFHCHCFADP
jgi:hypothetical protein